MTLPQFYTGRSGYRSAHSAGPHRLLVGVPCRIGPLADVEIALLDTAAEWCVLPPATAGELEVGELSVALATRLATRFGSLAGRLERLPLEFVADTGGSLTIEATWFVSPDWPGPVVIGWKGGLERLRFALDPGQEAFYFGTL